MFRATLLTLMVVALLSLAACGGATATAPAAPTTAPAAPTAAPKAAAPTVAPTAAAAQPTAAAKAAATTAPTQPAAAATAAPKAAAATAPAQPTAAAKAATGATRVYKLAADGTEARFLVKEQLANRNLPNDAVGTTKTVSGSIAIDPATGKVDPTQSKFTVNVASLATDVGMRDGFIKRNVLNTDQFPDTTFVIKEVKGLPTPLPTSGDVQFQILGDMTVRDVTKPITWDVTAKVNGNTVTGQAKTALKFADFNLTQPRVPAVLSIEDNIRLEIDFKLTA